jgi:hypothetical protein
MKIEAQVSLPAALALTGSSVVAATTIPTIPRILEPTRSAATSPLVKDLLTAGSIDRHTPMSLVIEIAFHQ